MNDGLKHGVDVAAAGVGVATVAEWLPSLAALFTIIWLALRIYESSTMQRILKWIRTKLPWG